MGVLGSSRFNVRTDVSNGVARLAIAGELDLQYAPSIGDRVQRAVNDGAEAAILDLRDVTFMDAAGLNALIAARDYASQNGHRLAIVGVGDAVRRVVEITGTEVLLIDENAGIELIREFTRSQAPGDSSTRSRDDDE